VYNNLTEEDNAMKYQVMVMSFDGEYKVERPEFESVEEAWEYENNLGSKWYFYPFPFIIKGKTVVDAIELLDDFVGKRIETVRRIFKETSEQDETQGMDAEEFCFYLLESNE